MPVTPVVPGGGTASGTPNAATGTDNPFPPGQCTWWADERYQQLTGYYVPAGQYFNGLHFGDAHEWYGAAMAAGWETSSFPPSSVPSIIVLQPGVQLADPMYGHVGVVEKVNPDGSVLTSDLNWGPTYAAKTQVTNVTFKLGPGVDFIWVGNAPVLPGNHPINSGAVTTFIKSVSQNTLNPSSDVASTLVAVDVALEIRNPFDLASYGETLNNVGLGPVQIGDPFQWAGYVAQNWLEDLSAIGIRLIFFVVGGLILYKVASAFIDFGAIYDTAKSSASSLSGLAGALA